MDIDNLLELVKRRRSIRRFKPDPVPEGCVEQIVEVARWAMSGGNGQPWEFIAVKEAGLRSQIFELYRENKKHSDALETTMAPELRHSQRGIFRTGATAFKDAPVIIAVLADPRTYLATSVIGRTLSGDRKTYHMNIANATFLVHLAAAALGLGSQWVSVGQHWESRLKELLAVPPVYSIPHIIPLGYPDHEPPAPYRREVAEILHRDRYDQSKHRTDEEIISFIASLRQRTVSAYHIA